RARSRCRRSCTRARPEEAPMRGIIPLVFVAAVWCSTGSMAASFRIDGGFIKDKAGRVLFFHGVNAVWKRPPYTPPSTLFGQSAATSYFDERDADFEEYLSWMGNWAYLDTTRFMFSNATREARVTGELGSRRTPDSP